MNKKELVELLHELAEGDLADGSNLADHPCVLAASALDRAFADIEFLRRIANGHIGNKSKAAKMLLGLNYDPSY